MSLFSSKAASIALIITAIVNLGASTPAILLPELNVDLLYGTDVELTATHLRFHYMLWAFVFAMGVGYAVGAKNPLQQSGLLVAAGIGKLSIALIWIEMLYSGLGTLLLMGSIAFDGLMGAYLLAVVVWGR